VKRRSEIDLKAQELAGGSNTKSEAFHVLRKETW